MYAWTDNAAEMVAGFAAEHGLETIVGTKASGNVLGASNLNAGAGDWERLPVFAWCTPTGDCLDGNRGSPHTVVEVDAYLLNAGVNLQMNEALETSRSLGNSDKALTCGDN